jgi:hypothetical protein
MASPISFLQPSFFPVASAFVQKTTNPYVVKFSPLFQPGGSQPCSEEPASPMPFMTFHNILVLLTINICFLSVRPTSCRFSHIQLSATVCAIYPQFLSISGDPASFHSVRTRHDLLAKDTENLSFTNRGLYLTSF